MSPKSLMCMLKCESDTDDLDDGSSESIDLEYRLLGKSSPSKSGMSVLRECFLGVATSSSAVSLTALDITVALRRLAATRSAGENAGNDWMSTYKIFGRWSRTDNGHPGHESIKRTCSRW